MTQPEHPSEALVYFIDADLLGVARALALVRSDVIYPGHANCPAVLPDTKDRIWLPEAGRHRWVVIQRDKRIRTRPGERQALLEHGLRSFCLTAAGHLSKWEILSLLVTHWPDIERTAREQEGPYIYSVTRQGVRPLLSVLAPETAPEAEPPESAALGDVEDAVTDAAVTDGAAGR